MRLAIRSPIGPAIVGMVLIAAVVAACNSDNNGEGPLVCGDGDPSPGYQEVSLDLFLDDQAIETSRQAPAGSIITLDAVVLAHLLENTMCGTEVAFEVVAGGGHLAYATANTGSTLVNDEYVASVAWTLGLPGPQTVHAWVADDPSIEATITLNATVAGTVTMYNGAEISVYLVGPGEATTAGGLLAPHAERTDVLIPTTVGSNAFFRAYNVGGSLIASITCQVTAIAWTGGTSPLVVLNATEGYFLTCDNGLVAP
jgi:hypothetical protein